MNYRLIFSITLISLIHTSTAEPQSNVAEDCSAIVTGDNNTTNIMCGDVIIEPDFSRDDFLNELRRRETQIRSEEREFRKLLKDNLEQKNQIAALEFQKKIRALEEQLKRVEGDLTNIDDAYLAKLGTISDRLNGLLQIKADVSADEFEAAFEALLAGDDQRAFDLFEKVNKSAEDAILVAASATFEQGKILEDRYDYIGAAAKYERAAQLDAKNLEYARESAAFASVIGNYELAVNDFRRIIDIIEEDSNEIELKERASIYTDAAIVYYNSGDSFLARIYFRRALDIIENNGLKNIEEEGKCLACLALIMIDMEEFGPAKEYLDRALRIAEEGGDAIQIADVTAKLGSWEFRQDKIPEAIRRYEESIKILVDAGKSDHPDVAAKLHNLGFLHNEAGDPCAASKYLDDALKIFKTAFGEGHPDYQTMLENQRFLDISKCE